MASASTSCCPVGLWSSAGCEQSTQSLGKVTRIPSLKNTRMKFPVIYSVASKDGRALTIVVLNGPVRQKGNFIIR